MKSAPGSENAPGPGAAPERATVRQWLGLGAMSLALFMLSTDVTVLYLAMPSISGALTPGGTQLLWILHIGEFLGAATVITFGLLVNRIGRRRLLMAGAAVYGAASLLAAFATTPEALIAARALLGLAGASFTPAGLSLLRLMFRSPGQFSFAFAVFMATFMGGAAAGPPVGGVLLEHFWWGSVFLVNVPAAVLVVLAAPFVLPRDRGDRSVRVDATSVVLSVAMVMALVFGLQEMAGNGLAPVPVLSTVLGAVLVALFLRRQSRSAHPLLDLGLFSVRRFRVLLPLLFVSGLFLAANDMLVLQKLQVVDGVPPLHSGMLMTAPAVAGIVGTLLAPAVQNLVGPRWTLAGTLVLTGLSAGAAVPLVSSGNIVGLIAALSGIMLFGSPFMALGSQMVITSVPEKRTGSASAVQDVFAGLGNASGVAFVGSLALAIYRSRLEAAMPPGLSPAERGTALDSVGAAAAVAERVGGETGAELMAAAGSAFALGTQSGYALGLVANLALAVAVILLLRRTAHTP